jgi:hypothetical protein
MAARVLEDPDRALAIADQQQRHPHEFYRLRVARFGNVRTKTDAGPGLEQQVALFFLKHVVRNIVLVRQSLRQIDRRHDGLQI